MADIEKEQTLWRQYPDYPFVEANQFGQIRTTDRTVVGKDGKKYYVKGRVLKQRPNNGGYMRVQFGVSGKAISRLVHRIVASCFLPNPLNLPEVNHIDNDPTNNVVSNLEWCTSEYNVAYREKYGTSAKEGAKVLRKPLLAVNLKTFEVLHFESQNEATRQLGIDRRKVNNVVNGQQNKTHDYWLVNADSNSVEKTRTKFGDEVAHKVKKLINENYS